MWLHNYKWSAYGLWSNDLRHRRSPTWILDHPKYKRGIRMRCLCQSQLPPEIPQYRLILEAEFSEVEWSWGLPEECTEARERIALWGVLAGLALSGATRAWIQSSNGLRYSTCIHSVNSRERRPMTVLVSGVSQRSASRRLHDILGNQSMDRHIRKNCYW